MLKTIQMLASSYVFGACRLRKPNQNSFFSISTTTYSLSYPACGTRTRTPINSSLPLPLISTRCRMATRSQSTMSESKPDNSSAVAARTSADTRKINFCQWCGGTIKHEIPDGEEKMRAICTLCRKITYQNPKMVVGCLIEHDNKVLLCKRNIQPSYGLWTLPAGYLENGESAAEGAMRETWEEACAEVEVLSPFAQLDIPLIGQTYIIFLGRLKKPFFSPGPESLECRLFALEDIPFESLAFSSMLVTLNLYIEDLKTGRLKFHYGTINKRPGTSPSDIRAHTLDYHLQS